ncbi:MAG: hypothetical protein AVDCRST_MAG53-752, partial [uncultured Solirubrobacteraceae bacterium]
DGRRARGAGEHARAERRVHADHVLGLRRLRRVRRGCSHARRLAPAGDGVDAAHVRRRVRRTERAARGRESL